jgi:iron complex transport system substrate-binding protein
VKRILLLCLSIVFTVAPCHASRTVVDEAGRTVTVPDHPHRIVCLVPSITDDMFSLGLGNDVIAISDYVQYPPEAKKKPSVGSISNPSIETILALHPDLILGMPHLNEQSSLDQIERLGIPVYLVDPHGIQGILHAIVSIGNATNHSTEATALVDRLNRRIAVVRANVKGKPIVNVFMPLSYDPVITIGKRDFITDIIDAAGGHSITDDITQEWPHISRSAGVLDAQRRHRNHERLKREARVERCTCCTFATCLLCRQTRKLPQSRSHRCIGGSG